MKAVTFYTRKDVLQTPMEALKKSMTVETLTKMALCLALISVSAYIAIPIPFTPVLITAQTIIVNLIALLLTPAQSAFVISVYTLMGLCGLPVFSGGAGGRIYPGIFPGSDRNRPAEGKPACDLAVLPGHSGRGTANHTYLRDTLHGSAERHGYAGGFSGTVAPLFGR